MRSFIAACLLLCSLHAGGTDHLAKFSQTGMDITDIWWNPSESGWGMNVIQASGTSFVTMFVYGANNQPTWYVASNVVYQGFDAANQEFVHSGALFVTSGPAYFTAFFNPGAVTIRQVGTLTLRTRLSSITLKPVGRLTYTVDGVTVNKNVEKQSLGTTSHAGTYQGSLLETWTGCNNAGANRDYLYFGRFTVSQTTTNLTITFVATDASFSYVFGGRYSQTGRNGAVPEAAVGASGSGGYSDSAVGSVQDMNSGVSGMSGTAVFVNFRNSPGCSGVVRFAGVL